MTGAIAIETNHRLQAPGFNGLQGNSILAKISAWKIPQSGDLEWEFSDMAVAIFVKSASPVNCPYC